MESESDFVGDKERKREGEEGELEQRTTGDEKGKKKKGAEIKIST